MAQSSGRTDNRGRAGPGVTAVFMGPSHTSNIGYTKVSERSTDVVDAHAHGEAVEHGLDSFISRGHEQRRKSEGDRAEEVQVDPPPAVS